MPHKRKALGDDDLNEHIDRLVYFEGQQMYKSVAECQLREQRREYYSEEFAYMFELITEVLIQADIGVLDLALHIMPFLSPQTTFHLGPAVMWMDNAVEASRKKAKQREGWKRIRRRRRDTKCYQILLARKHARLLGPSHIARQNKAFSHHAGVIGQCTDSDFEYCSNNAFEYCSMWV